MRMELSQINIETSTRLGKRKDHGKKPGAIL